MSNEITVDSKTMSSVEIAALTGKEHRNVMRDIRTMLESLGGGALSFEQTYLDGQGKTQPCFHLPHDETICLMTGYDARARMAVIKRWQELEAAAPAPAILSPAEMFLRSAQAMVAFETRTAKVEQAQVEMSARLDAVADAAALKECPQNAEPISHIRKRIAKQYGIPIHVIDTAMRQLPYSPKPAGMVVNSNEAAQGAKYAVWWRQDVTKMFKVFVSECQRETTSFVSHPFIDGRFKLAAA